jgi:altronate dehydratase large subunit
MPVVKVSSNTRVFNAMADDIDINAGVLMEGRELLELRDEMIQRLIRVINGEKTKAEINGMDVFTFMTVHPPF